MMRAKLDAEDALASNTRALSSMSLSEVADLVAAAVLGDGHTPKTKKNTVIDTARELCSLKGHSTALTYERTIKHIEKFSPSVTFDEIDQLWLMKFDRHMSECSPSPNSRAIHMRNLRAVFNFAIDQGVTSNYPFRKFHIKTVKTVKRNLSADDMRTLLTMEVNEWQRPYRDFFALSFFLMGANAKDILYLPPRADDGGRIQFNRSKTSKLYDIRVEAEAQRIIDEYRGVAHMINVMDTRTDYLQYIRYCNHALKSIGTNSAKGKKTTGTPLFPNITTYWARHSWATIAASLDIPKETIAAALGHDMGNSTTAIYIDFDRRKVDEANRRVIDWVLYGNR